MCILFSPSHLIFWKEEIRNDAVPSEFSGDCVMTEIHQAGKEAPKWNRQYTQARKCTLITCVSTEQALWQRAHLFNSEAKEEIRLFHHPTCQHQLTLPLNPSLFQLCCKFTVIDICTVVSAHYFVSHPGTLHHKSDVAYSS